MPAASIDGGKIGKVTAGTAYVMSHGMEMWHPNPDFFFLPGAGPVLDLGPYYITNLINLIGPVKRVAALAIDAGEGAHHHHRAAQRRGDPGRDADQHPRAAGIRQRRGGDAERELGRLGAPPRADGALRHGRRASSCRTRTSSAARSSYTRRATRVEEAAEVGAPASPCPTRSTRQGAMANYRTAGLADMAMAILEGPAAPLLARPRAARGRRDDLDPEVAARRASSSTLQTTCTRPAALGIEDAKALLAKKTGRHRRVGGELAPQRAARES